MSHRGFQEQFGTPFHLDWNSEAVKRNGTGSDIKCVVDLDIPLDDFDHGKGVLAKGTLLSPSSTTWTVADWVSIRGERWNVTSVRKQEDGYVMVYITQYRSEFTSPRAGGYAGGR